MNNRQMTKLFELRQAAQDKFYSIVKGRVFLQLSTPEQGNAMYNKGREEALSEALFILDLI